MRRPLIVRSAHGHTFIASITHSPADSAGKNDTYFALLFRLVKYWDTPEGVEDVRAHGTKHAATLAGISPPSEFAVAHGEQHIGLHHEHSPYGALAQMLPRPEEGRCEAQLMVYNHHLPMHAHPNLKRL